MQFWNHHNPTSGMERVESPEPWRYGDEASLYSIAEDSREDRVSVSASGVHTNNNAMIDAPRETSSNATPGVELCIADDDLTRSSSDEIFYYHKPHGSRRKCHLLGVMCIVCTLMGGIIATVLFTQFNRVASESRSSASINSGSDANVGSEVAAADEADLSDSRLAMAETHVLNALNPCQGTSESLLDPQTMQGRIYSLLVQEVFDGATIDNFGMVAFAELHGEEFLQERYALEMLYFKTKGDDWTKAGGWEIGSTASDPCSWYGVTCESSRNVGMCAVTSVQLDNNNLAGELPQEFCCLPCVKSISMADNNIGGPILTCLSSMLTLKQIDFSNNAFDSFGYMGASTAQSLSTTSP